MQQDMIPADGRSADTWPRGRVGYVALLGRPNTGKSTFMNTVLGFHLAAVSPKPQTTRRNCLGILSDADSQILFLDAPGVHVPRDQLGEAMDRAVTRTLADADAILCLCDPTREPGAEDALVAERAAATGKPVFAGINKTDIASPAEAARAEACIHTALPGAPVYRIAAVAAETLVGLLQDVRAALPNGPFLYPPDELTDTYERTIGAELIREALLEHLRQEVPHAMAVVVDKWQDRPKRCHIDATLYVERDSQKAVVVGRGGAMLKSIRRGAVVKLRELCAKPITLKLWVKVAKQWRRKQDRLRDFGLVGP